MSTLAFTSEMARLQQAIAEWHDLVFGAVRPSRRRIRGPASPCWRRVAAGAITRIRRPGLSARRVVSARSTSVSTRVGQHKLGAPSRVGLNARIANAAPP